MEDPSFTAFAERRGMRKKPREYVRFLWMLDKRGLDVTGLAVVIRGKKAVAGKDGIFRPVGRTALNETLLGRRPGPKIWGDLKARALNPAEYECIRAFADAERVRLRNSGAVDMTELERLRRENEALRKENSGLHDRIELLDEAVRWRCKECGETNLPAATACGTCGGKCVEQYTTKVDPIPGST